MCFVLGQNIGQVGSPLDVALYMILNATGNIKKNIKYKCRNDPLKIIYFQVVIYFTRILFYGKLSDGDGGVKIMKKASDPPNEFPFSVRSMTL